MAVADMLAYYRQREGKPLSQGEARLQEEQDIREQFLDSVAGGMSCTCAGIKANVPRRVLYHWKWKYPAFDKAWRKAQLQGAVARLRVALHRCGLELTITPLSSQTPLLTEPDTQIGGPRGGGWRVVVPFTSDYRTD
jgi:hypothetical protein